MAVVGLSITSNIASITASLTVLEKQQLPFALRLAMTRTAQQAKIDLRAEMQRRFDKPTPYTLGALYVQPTTRTGMTASVEIKDEVFKCRKPATWLTPEIEGGERNKTGYELKLSGVSGSMYAVPSKQIDDQLNQYGNLSRGKLRMLLSRLSVASGSGYDANIGDKTRNKLRKQGKLHYLTRGKQVAASDFFVAWSKKNNRPLGVYQYLGNHQVKPWLIFTDKRPAYQARLPFNDIVNQSVQKNITPLLVNAISEAVNNPKSANVSGTYRGQQVQRWNK